LTPLVPTEHVEQCTLMAWASRVQVRMPELNLLFAIPNAGAGAQRGQAGKMKAEGVKSGVPDLCLPVPRGRYHGAFIEMKRRKGGRLSPEQVAWRAKLEERGYAYCLACGFDEARVFLEAYLG
jgi:hypothetical protein